MTSSPIAAVSDVLSSHVLNTAIDVVPATARDRRDLAETLAAVPDPRRRRGVRHPFTPLLAAVTCAMLAGSRSFAAIAEWVADLPAAARTDLGLTGPVPVASTLWRLLTAVDPTALQDAVGAWLRARLTWRPVRADRHRRRGRRVLAVDGRAMRATLRGVTPLHLLAVLDHATSIVLAQVNVDAKTNELWGRCAAPRMWENWASLAWSTPRDLGVYEPVNELGAGASGRRPELLPVST